ncbi:MAG: TIGR04282 family arsenosugar biosynthesis glycosyltransferase [Gemmatimonadetes bacterium]|nr:TIGR04282 family arsenosugar biosynthesis glycosyltransferase [Gemmatimonadota bacterium]
MYSPLPGDRVVVFARAPESGRVKTRLAATVGDARALAIYVQLAERVTRAVAMGPWALEIRCAPDEAAPSVATWLGRRDGVVPQGGGDLGARLTRAMFDHFASSTGRLVIIGTDCPAVDAQVIQHAFAALAGADVVFGPALDGGYYLVGSGRHAPAIFDGVPWSASDTLEVSLRRARAAGYRVAELDPLRDIDTEEDWAAWASATTAEAARAQRTGTDEVPARDG